MLLLTWLTWHHMTQHTCKQMVHVNDATAVQIETHAMKWISRQRQVAIPASDIAGVQVEIQETGQMLQAVQT